MLLLHLSADNSSLHGIVLLRSSHTTITCLQNSIGALQCLNMISICLNSLFCMHKKAYVQSVHL